SRPARPSGSRQDNAGNHPSHPTGRAQDAIGCDARGMGQRYAARCGSADDIILEKVVHHGGTEFTEFFKDKFLLSAPEGWAPGFIQSFGFSLCSPCLRVGTDE